MLGKKAIRLPQLPDKRYFRIGEVSDLLEVKPHVVRYWESEFPTLVPTKSPAQQRLYRKKDIESLFLIKHLLYEEGYTVAGARARLGSVRGSFEFFYPGDEAQKMMESTVSLESAFTLDPDHAQIAATGTALSPEDFQNLLLFVRKELVHIRETLQPFVTPRAE